MGGRELIELHYAHGKRRTFAKGNNGTGTETAGISSLMNLLLGRCIMEWTQGHSGCMITVATGEVAEEGHDQQASNDVQAWPETKGLDEKGSAGGLVSS